MAPNVSQPRNMTGSSRTAGDASNNLSEVGATGLKRAGGYIYEEFLPNLQGERGVNVYKEMSGNDPIVGAILYAIEMFLRKVEWRVQPFADQPDDQVKADFLRDCMDDMSTSWPDFIAEVLSMLTYGWSYFEIVYKKRDGWDVQETVDANGKKTTPATSKYDDGLIGWRKFAPRSQDSFRMWVFDDEGGVQAMTQQAAPLFIPTEIPIQKALLFRTTSRKNNPEGRSMLRNAYRPWYFKKRIEEVEGIGVERDLAGLPIVYMPAEYLSQSATAAQKATVASFQTLVRNVRRDEQEGVLFPVEYDDEGHEMFRFELMSSGGTRTFDTSGIIERYDKRIAMTTLTDFILLGQSEQGSYALSVSKVGMFQAALEAFLDNIASVLNNHAVPRLWKLNGFDLSRMPTIEHENVQQPTIEDIATFLQAMTASGAPMFPDIELENTLRRRMALPEREDPDENGDDDIEEQNELDGTQVTEPDNAKPVMPATPPQPPQPQAFGADGFGNGA